MHSTNEAHYAGSGGSIDVEGNFTYYGDDDDLYLQGGNRYGSTTVSNTGAPQANGGSVEVGGNLVCREDIYLEGGGVFTDYPNAPGGNGGYMYVSGALYCADDTIYMDGGRSVGNSGVRAATSKSWVTPGSTGFRRAAGTPSNPY